MSQPEPQPDPHALTNESVTVLCEECGAMVTVKDPASLIRALHLKNECILSPLLSGAQE